MNVATVCRLAQNLARNCGYAVFPCNAQKRPTIPSPNPGEGGFYRASKDADEIARLWHDHPGPLIGIRTGEASGIDVVDVDSGELPEDATPEAIERNNAARWWWKDNGRRLLGTSIFATRSRGLHLYYRHADGIRISTDRINKGVDVRGEGGYCISWFATGLRQWDLSPPDVWPAWLFRLALPPPPVPIPHVACASPDSAIAGIVRRLAAATEGERNSVTFWAASRLHERGIACGDAITLLMPAAIAAGQASAAEQKQTRATIASAYRAGRAAA